MEVVAYMVLGLAAGSLSGLFGVGGGVVIIPGLVYLFRFTEHQAQGTSLAAMIPPIGLLAALTYYYNGYVHIRAAALIALGFFLGGLFGASFAQMLSELQMKRFFGLFLIGVGLYMIAGK